MLSYTNGLGHLIMSILLILVGVLLILYPGISQEVHAIGISMILTVSSTWFIPGAARQVLNQVQQQQNGEKKP